MTATVAEVLEDAAQLVERGWCQGAIARDAEGNPCHTRNAACLCGLGAIAVSAGFEGTIFDDTTAAVRAHLAGPQINKWNDQDGQTAENVAGTFRVVARGVK